MRQELSQVLEHPAIKYHSLSDITAEKLRSAIITGSLQPGTRITETEIGESMGVSRVVVREAILILIQEGLLSKERNKYTMVARIGRKDIEDIFDLRIAIEQAAASRCIRNSDFASSMLPKLEIFSAQISNASVATAIPAKELMYMDMRFHNLLVEASGNGRLMVVWHEISGPLLLLLYRYIELGSALHYRHDNILDALRTRDLDESNDVLAKHIEDTKAALLRACCD